MWSTRLKRVFDVAVSASAIVLLSPVLGVIAAAVRVKLGSPIFFRHIRPGMNEEPFELVKFRTMLDTRGEDGKLLPDAERTVPFGTALRSTSLDELPTLINVLRGDMSLVGPRPLLTRYLPHYSEHQRRRHQVRPGITGLAQVNGRNALNWAQLLELDVEYVESMSFRRDVAILIKTFNKVARKDGVATDGREIGRTPFDVSVAPSARRSVDDEI